ncbi:uncharacterized protein MKK02DRAFT_40871 [Dioszegia hungarica]|uniref:DUF1275 domain protein n=1 Tax=Dioszegia hungarica TaxID=4972 RepID=A0AA38H0I7_9TREE|nr:uncharacterized protein MKK02DRAFT_40871 [Dioszegia hungarica]KAI9632567.1 hypothetical protein MKK02DRAFT_40871 [Dioszegia hungarica]
MPLSSGYSPSSETFLLAFSFNHPHVPPGAYGSIAISRSASPTAPLDDQSSTTASAVLSIWSRWVGSAGILADYELPFQIRSSRGYGEADHPEHRRGKRRWRQRGREDVPADALVLPLLVITFSCAMADAGTLVAYQTFATSMTGNTVLLAIAAFGLSPKRPIYAAASLSSFIGAGLIFGQLGGMIGHRHRSWLLFSLTVQIALLFLATWTVSPLGWPSLRYGGRSDWVYLLLIGLQGGPQVTLATNSGVRELPTAMMTTPYAAFISDPSLFSFPSTALSESADVISRNRRFLYIVFFWAGAFAGGALMKRSSLWALTGVVGALKAFAALLVWVSKAEEALEEAGPPARHGRRLGVEEEAVGEMETETEGSALIIERGQKTRTSSIFGSLSRQKPRDEHSIAM